MYGNSIDKMQSARTWWSTKTHFMVVGVGNWCADYA